MRITALEILEFTKKENGTAYPTAWMSRLISAVLFPTFYTTLEKKTIFYLTPNFLIFTLPILSH